MKEFTGWEYLLIDVANHFGLDKLPFENRIEWASYNLAKLETLADQAENNVLYRKAVMAIRKAQAGEPQGHLVALDAVCSGLQIMSVLTGCENGASATGLIDPDRRADAYTEVTEEMNHLLAEAGFNGVSFPRPVIKRGVMTSFYGSQAVPKQLFGDGTPELAIFKEACYNVAPGASLLLQELLNTWVPFALSHDWVLPDNFHAHIKVMDSVEKKIEVDELEHATFSYRYQENVGLKTGLANAANVVHSIDAYVLRSVVRRCNYDLSHTHWVRDQITAELIQRTMGATKDTSGMTEEVATYVRRFETTQMVDVVILPYLDEVNIMALSDDHLRRLNQIVNQMLEHPPFPVITIHDSFAALPNHCNVVRYWYKEILAELAESNVLQDIFTQLKGQLMTLNKRSWNLASKIRASNYALC